LPASVWGLPGRQVFIPGNTHLEFVPEAAVTEDALPDTPLLPEPAGQVAAVAALVELGVREVHLVQAEKVETVLE